ncbi:hypothetical protein BGZ80_007529 [Entomortierella chlamydospora]|uniref:Uncharacterized protein n=1 Tax=Entomortierella chlamydospora TaxID=101097 RepID=A0A9P6MZ06_9FUNG|nr:hypothetical protein BGZ79_008326 [Entomortierella chlamydospora]KAG0018110.1 hypothetical protein BGZ80_007529 [Entomortierella chlamydospora]
MSRLGLKYMVLLVCLWLECSILVAGTIVLSYPRSDTTWIPGETYNIKFDDDRMDKDVKNWQVDLMVLGAECDDIRLHDGVVASISKSYNTQSALYFKVPTNLLQHGKGFLIQFSNAGSVPIYQSGIFSIGKATAKRLDTAQEELLKRDISSEANAPTSENSAPFVLPTVLATALVLGFSFIFAFFML